MYLYQLKAFRKHKQVHVLDGPGTADLTADVDFAFLKHSIENNDGKKILQNIYNRQLFS